MGGTVSIISNVLIQVVTTQHMKGLWSGIDERIKADQASSETAWLDALRIIYTIPTMTSNDRPMTLFRAGDQPYPWKSW